MKPGWSSGALGELCSIAIGSTPSRKRPDLWDPNRSTGNVWLSIADLLRVNGKVVSDSKEYVSDAGAKLCRSVSQGTLLVSFKLTLGRVAFAGRDLFTNEAIAAVSPADGRVCKEYLYYYLQNFDWKTAAQNDIKLKGMTFNKAKMAAIRVHFPESLDEQHRIVAQLDDAFAFVADLRERAERKIQCVDELRRVILHRTLSERE